jgi:hypothetical protein
MLEKGKKTTSTGDTNNHGYRPKRQPQGSNLLNMPATSTEHVGSYHRPGKWVTNHHKQTTPATITEYAGHYLPEAHQSFVRDLPETH